jgi:hypothetical protein
MQFKLIATKQVSKTEYLGARVDLALKKRFETACLDANTTVSQGLQQLIEAYLLTVERPNDIE